MPPTCARRGNTDAAEKRRTTNRASVHSPRRGQSGVVRFMHKEDNTGLLSDAARLGRVTRCASDELRVIGSRIETSL